MTSSFVYVTQEKNSEPGKTIIFTPDLSILPSPQLRLSLELDAKRMDENKQTL